jgi:hypothetical protein
MTQAMTHEATDINPFSKSRGILFSAPMVRALLAGAKTQTRRILRVEDGDVIHNVDGEPWRSNIYGMKRLTCPYGVRGDRLWVRETWARLTGNGHRIVYRADGEDPRTGWDDVPPERRPKMTWVPSIHLAKRDSRITLLVEHTNVERLQMITEEDIKAEGIYTDAPLYLPGEEPPEPDEDPRAVGYPHGGSFALQNWIKLWDAINGKRAPWSSNPWVWRVTFRVIDVRRSPQDPTR